MTSWIRRHGRRRRVPEEGTAQEPGGAGKFDFTGSGALAQLLIMPSPFRATVRNTRPYRL
ncbi:hypothetical protein GCM10010361_21680 [Streptomyces olivaceiscleroticus]|uniref:Uncharacterized protein n=1 Tax=Streptomyces olivaceiscleroticus TaxID=68245 RepID=A0ABN0ZS62_9ACTN